MEQLAIEMARFSLCIVLWLFMSPPVLSAFNLNVRVSRMEGVLAVAVRGLVAWVIAGWFGYV